MKPKALNNAVTEAGYLTREFSGVLRDNVFIGNSMRHRKLKCKPIKGLFTIKSPPHKSLVIWGFDRCA